LSLVEGASLKVSSVSLSL